MEDTFFGFDTSVPLDEDGNGRIAEPSEEEYDALNDETFGSAVNGDWEEVHENLVRLTDDFDEDCGTFDSEEHVASGRYGSVKTKFQSFADSDLELNFSGMKMDDVDFTYGDDERDFLGGTIKMDPSVWSSESSDQTVGEPTNNMAVISSSSSNPEEFLREYFPNPFQCQKDHNKNKHQFLPFKESPVASFGLSSISQVPLQQQPKICTLADVERNIMQHSIPKQTAIRHQQQDVGIITKQKVLNDILSHSSETPTILHQTEQLQQQQNHQLFQQYSQLLAQQGPGGFSNPNQQSLPRPSNHFGNNLIHHPLGNLLQQQDITQQSALHTQPLLAGSGNRLPPRFHYQHQFPQPICINQHGWQSNFPNQRPLSNAHLPVALNNFAMHPNFNVMRGTARGMHPATILAQQQHALQPRHPPNPPNPVMLVNQNQNSSFNMFNMRLVQEIQQNHPLLQNPARQAQHHQQQNTIDRNHSSNNSHTQRNGSGSNVPIWCNTFGNQRQTHNMRRDIVSANGNLPHEDYDEYANLMSTREKHWLIGIQLSQLNTDTPYIDDYYYTVYKERKVALSGNIRHSQAHTDNQLNHPLTQPKGHAQLILVQLGNKNCQRNAQYRERRNTENHNQNQDVKFSTYVFTPLKFENSLGKLQFGSVNAPRKIIDAEIMGNEPSSKTSGVVKDSSVQLGRKASEEMSASNKAADTTLGTLPLLHIPKAAGEITSVNNQRKSRYILLHIESMYRILLKLEDLNNTNMIATILMKKKKERERIYALEQLENANKTQEECTSDSSNSPSKKSKFNYDIETKDVLIKQLVEGLQHEKVVAMMNVRKGKVLIRRIMPNIENVDIRWNVWIAVFNSLQNVLKKDRDDAEGVLYSLYPDFVKHIKSANFDTVVKISSAITLHDKKSNGVFCSKFVISSLVCLILQAENIYEANDDATLTDNNKDSWRRFLDQFTSTLSRTIEYQTVCAAIEPDSIQPIINHFARFKDLKLDSLLNLITEAKQQIN